MITSPFINYESIFQYMLQKYNIQVHVAIAISFFVTRILYTPIFMIFVQLCIHHIHVQCIYLIYFGGRACTLNFSWFLSSTNILCLAPNNTRMYYEISLQVKA